MIYPLSKYRFHEYTDKKTGIKTIVAVSTYAGKKVKGIAKCHPADNGNYDTEKGKELAAARCNLKIANKRRARALKKENEARIILEQAQEHLKGMNRYWVDSTNAVLEAERHLEEILNNL